MKHFEYKTLKEGINTDNHLQTESDLNEAGLEGWELTSVNQVGMNLVYYFKRETSKPKKNVSPKT